MSDSQDLSKHHTSGPLLEYRTLGVRSYRIEQYEAQNLPSGPKSARRGRLKFNDVVPTFTLELGRLGGTMVGERLANSEIEWGASSGGEIWLRVTSKLDSSRCFTCDVVETDLDEFAADLSRRISLANQVEVTRQSFKPLPSALLRRATYIGGLPQERSSVTGTLVLDSVGISIRESFGARTQQYLQWKDCAGLLVEGGEVAKRKIAAVLVFGVLGGLAAKGAKDQTVITARCHDGTGAYFVIDKMAPHEVRAAIHPTLHSLEVPFLNDVSLPDPKPIVADVQSVAAELRELVALRDEGVLTDEEFAVAKAQLLSR